MARPLVLAAASAPSVRDLDASLAMVGGIIAEARERGADLLVLPECVVGGYQREPTDARGGLDLPPALRPEGPEIARLARMAGDMTVVAGYTEQGETGIHTSAVCVSGDGVLGHQRKVHLPPAERFAYSPGEGFAAFDTPVGRLGMLVCYDKLFPEAARELALDGAQTIACISAWCADRHDPARRIAADKQTRHFDVVDQVRAIENQVAWVSTNQVGRWGPLRFLGGAKVVDPDGVVRARTGARAGMAVAEVDVAGQIADLKAHIDHLGDRMPAAYAPRGSAATSAAR